MRDLAMTAAADTEQGLSLNELSSVLSALSPRLVGDGAVRVRGVRQDSRKVLAGELFVARPGGKTSGASFALDAAAKGAAALLVQRGEPLPATRLPVLEIDNAKLGLALAAEAVYGFPSRAIDVVGVTGTNGKTTTTFLIEQGLTATNGVPARLGTLGFEMGGHQFGDTLTTPEADDIARCLLEVKARRGSHLVMEVSSIAVVQERVSGLRFKAAAFTNLTQDHLDFHGTLAAYGEAKAELFTRLLPETSVVHVGDAFGRQLAGRIRSGLLTVARANADVSVRSSELTARGIRATPFGRPVDKLRETKKAPMERHEGGYYIRLMARDLAGTAATIATRLAEQKISLESIVQRHPDGVDAAGATKNGAPVPVILITYATHEDAVHRALAAVQKDKVISGRPQVIRIEKN